jgi:hypothetical protein
MHDADEGPGLEDVAGSLPLGAEIVQNVRSILLCYFDEDRGVAASGDFRQDRR